MRARIHTDYRPDQSVIMQRALKRIRDAETTVGLPISHWGRSAVAPRPTPERKHANVRVATIAGEDFRMTRGERKRLARVLHIGRVLESRQGGAPKRHQHPRRLRHG